MIAVRDVNDADEAPQHQGDATDTDRRRVAAAIDIGSNSIKMTVARMDGASGFEQVAWASETVRLGEGLDETGRLDEQRMIRATETIGRFAEQARTLGAATIVAVATEATRAAANGNEFLDRVREATGIDVRVIGGLEEAALTFRGLSATTNLAGTVLIADVGGGSTELIVTREGEMASAQSLPLGSGRLTARWVHNDPPRMSELEACEAAADEALRVATKQASLPDEARLIVVGGTGEFLTRLVPDPEAIDQDAVRSALAKTTVLTAAELADAIEAPEARARVLPAGLAIIAALATRARPERIEVSRSGVRAGLLLEAFADSESEETSSDHAQALSDVAARVGEPVANQDGRTQAEVEFRGMMKALIAERWQAVWDAIPAALDGADIEGVHDVRVASRRLRAAMDTAAPLFPQEWFKRLHKTAKRITGELGAVRDRDVLLEAWARDRENASLAERPGIDRLIERVERERSIARTAMEQYLRELLTGDTSDEIERRFGTRIARRNGASAERKRE